MDVLGDVLLGTRLLACVGGLLDLAAPWGVDHCDEASNLAFGVILLEGPCWFEAGSMPALEMRPGDCIVTLRGLGHQILSAPGARTVRFDDFLKAQGIQTMTVDHRHEAQSAARVGDGDVRTRLLVFGLIAEDAGPSSIIAHLPQVLHIAAGAGWLSSWIPAMAKFFEQGGRPGPGHAATVTRLVELMFTEVVREYILTASGLDANWMRGLRDPSIGRAITCIHSRPHEPWTVGQLAREAGMGRSTFARRFSRLLGMSPIDYLVDHRMNLACARLSVDRQSVAAVAEALGYRSERAFRKAFRNRFGVAPSRYARAAGREG